MLPAIPKPKLNHAHALAVFDADAAPFPSPLSQSVFTFTAYTIETIPAGMQQSNVDAIAQPKWPDAADAIRWVRDRPGWRHRGLLRETWRGSILAGRKITGGREVAIPLGLICHTEYRSGEGFA